MPKFPTYRGELPKCLNPLNPHHYFLLLYWIFFRPAALKCYLYQADPKLYRTKMGKSIFRTWNVSAYRNLYVMMPVISMLFSVLLGLPFTLLLGWNKAIPIDWLLWIIGMAVGVVAGVGFGIGFGIILCVRNDLAASVAFSAVLGVFSGMATSVWMGATAGVALNVGFSGTFDTPLGVTTGLVFGIGGAIIAGMAITSVVNWKVGVLVGLVCGVIVSVGVGGVFGIGGAIGVEQEFGVAFGLLGGIIGNVLVGMALNAAGNVRGNFVLGVASCLIFGVMSSLMVDATTGLSLCIGALRLVFYPLQLALALCSKFWRIRHPLEWDELIVFPLPGKRKALTRRLQQNEKKGLHFLADVGRNPFQRSVMQKVLHHHLHKHADPIQFLYTLLTDLDFEEYVITPTKPKNWEQNPVVYHLFLGELALQLVITRKGIYTPFFEKLTWWMSYPLRERRRTHLTHFAGMLYELLDIEVIEAEEFTLSSYSEIYNNLSAYSGGEEIAQTFDAMATFLAYNNISNLPDASEVTSNLTFGDPIRRTVLTALNRLGQVGAEIAVYRDSSSRANRLAALARATDALKELNEYVQAKVMAPEWYLLRRIIRQWQQLMIEAGGELGRAEVTGPVANPYIAGNPVTGELFVGREDILRRLEELWSGAGQKPSVVLYGHRRMGKSSILHNLGARFGKDTVIVDFNMQRVGLVASTGELLYNLALAVYDSIVTPPYPPQGGNEPTPGPSQEGNTPPYPPQGGSSPSPNPSHQGRGTDSPTPGPSQEGNTGEAPGLPGNDTPLAPLKGGILAEPEEERFTAHNPYTAFDRFLKQVDLVRGERRFIITVDEFELIEQKIKDGKLEAQLLDFWRGVIQTYPWFVMAFAGLHTLQEMTRDYWHPLFGSVTGIPVSFLQEGAARKLITQPTADFDLDYDTDAIERIIGLTHGQPYLLQLICHCLVTRFNRQTFEEGIAIASQSLAMKGSEKEVERERRFSLEDVEAVINAPEFYRDGDAYFTGIWRQAEADEATRQQQVLCTLAQSEAGGTIEELVQQSDLALKDVQRALDVLKRHDVVTESKEKWQFTVELMRRWVGQKR